MKVTRLNEKYALPCFGPHLWDYEEREARKRHGGTVEECVAHLYALFCRSVEARGKLDHPLFADYAAIMVANGLPWMDEKLSRQLGERYPRRKSNRCYIKPGFSYWKGEKVHNCTF